MRVLTKFIIGLAVIAVIAGNVLVIKNNAELRNQRDIALFNDSICRLELKATGDLFDAAMVKQDEMIKILERATELNRARNAMEASGGAK